MRQGNHSSFWMRLTTFFASRMLFALSIASGWWRLATTRLAHELLHREDAVPERLVVVHEVEGPGSRSSSASFLYARTLNVKNSDASEARVDANS